jgi:hypothetical protein
MMTNAAYSLPYHMSFMIELARWPYTHWDEWWLHGNQSDSAERRYCGSCDGEPSPLAVAAG